MNPWRGGNPNLEESYIPEFREYEDEILAQCLTCIFIRPVKLSAFDPSPISRYSECTKTTSFSILGFTGPGSN